MIEDLAGAWRGRDDVAGRALRLIADGVVAREGTAGLARRLGRDEAAVRDALVAAAGAGPEALDRSAAAASARALLEGGELSMSEVARATGFGSAVRLGAAIREAYGVMPSGRPREPAPGGAVRLLLRCRAPADLGAAFAFLARRAVPGVEEPLDGGGLRRSLRLPRGPGVVELTAAAGDGGGVRCMLWAADLRDVVAAVARCRRLLDLDAHPAAVAARLGGDPLLGPLVRASPGRRAPGHVDGPELAVRAVLGQQVSLAAARTLAGRLVADHGERLPFPHGGVTHLFPTPAAVAAADPATLAMPRSRRTALLALGRALADGDLALDPGADRERGPPRPARAAGRRAVDGGLRRPARARRPRRLPGLRPRRAPRAARARRAVRRARGARARRGVAAVARLRDAPPVGVARYVPIVSSAGPAPGGAPNIGPIAKFTA